MSRTPAVVSKGVLLPLGLVAGSLSGMLGIGGGLVIGPALVLLGLPVARAVGTSLVFVAPVAAVAVLAGLATDFRGPVWISALAVALGGQLGAPLGAALVQRLPARGLRLLFVAFLFYMSLVQFGVFAGGVPGSRPGLGFEDGLRFLLDLLLGVGAGISSGLFGIGGGVIVVPGLLHLHGGILFPAAAATSLMAMVPTASRGAWLAYTQGRVDRSTVRILLPSAAFGAIGGVLLRDQVLSPRVLERIFAAFLLYAALRVLARRD